MKQSLRTLLEICPLEEGHIQSLKHRGFNDKDIDTNGYKTMPMSRQPIIDKFLQNNSCEGVPGFWYDKEKSNKGWCLAGMTGIMIPARDINGEIFNIKIRRDGDDVYGKYTSLSSGYTTDSKTNKRIKRPKGTNARIGIHFPLGQRTSTIRITEGELKADLTTKLSGIYTISVPGVNSWSLAIDAIKQLQPDKVLLAFDADKEEEFNTSNDPKGQPHQTGKSLAQLYLALKRDGFVVEIEHWNGNYGKGIDDVYMNDMQDKIEIWENDKCDQFTKTILSDTIPLDWVYVKGIKRFINTSNGIEYDKEQFNDHFAEQIDSATHKCIKNPAFPKVDIVTYAPNEKTILNQSGLMKINLWRDSGVVSTEGDATPFIKHIEYLIEGKQDRKVFMSYLAFNVQSPGEKVKWAVLLQGKQGTGKSYVGGVMSDILGKHNVSMPSNEVIHENFTGWAKQCQMIIIEELMARGRLELMNKLKPMITQEHIMIREMYKPPYEIECKFNLLFFTNHKDSIIIDNTDRRYFVLFSEAEPMSEDYYKKLWNWTSNNKGVILNYLQQYDISQFNPNSHAPRTNAKDELMKEVEMPAHQWVRDCIDNKVWPFNKDIIAIKHLSAVWPQHIRKPTNPVIRKTLREVGLNFMGFATNAKTKERIDLWCVRDWEDHWKKQDAQEVYLTYYLSHPVNINPIPEDDINPLLADESATVH